MTISTCPGDFDIDIAGEGEGVERDCFKAGSINGLYVIADTQGVGICTVSPGVTYYMNIAPVHPVDLKPDCSAPCGVVVSVYE